MKKPISCKIIDLGLFPTDTIYAYFNLWSLDNTLNRQEHINTAEEIILSKATGYKVCKTYYTWQIAAEVVQQLVVSAKEGVMSTNLQLIVFFSTWITLLLPTDVIFDLCGKYIKETNKFNFTSQALK